MTLQELQKQALQLPISDRWQLVQAFLGKIDFYQLSHYYFFNSIAYLKFSQEFKKHFKACLFIMTGEHD
ncbi:MAG: hypothetical protein ACOYMQ_08495 [Pseudanabaena sp.]|jgi:hypothetical protein